MAGLILAGCAPPDPPEVTFYADGHAVDTAPAVHCDVMVRSCDRQPDAGARLTVRPGQPVQVSVPSDIADTPWLVNVQYTNAAGELPPVQQETFTPGTQHAYTATAGVPDGQLVVVEIQQLGAAYAADEAGDPILDADGNPQLRIRAIWSLQIEPG